MRTGIFIQIVFFTFWGLSLTAQSKTEWTDWTDLFKDSELTVQISMKFDSTSCVENKLSKYKFRISGVPKSYYSYVVFKFDYVNCQDHVFCEQLSIPVGPDAQLEQEIKSQDYTFAGKTLVNPTSPYYDVRLEQRPEVGHFDKGAAISIPAREISGNTNLKYGEQTVLTVVGGNLAPGASWNWYIDQCGTTSVGTGSSIIVSPKQNVTYFVRAEDSKMKTSCVAISISIDLNSHAATGIGGEMQLCPGNSSRLSVLGGWLGKDATWMWYEDAECTRRVGVGVSIVVTPAFSTSYYVRAEAGSSVTTIASARVEIVRASVNAQSIAGPTSACEGELLGLAVVGGSLGTNASWVWYNDEDEKIGVGPSIAIRAARGHVEIRVRAENKCSETEFAMFSIDVSNASSIAGIFRGNDGRKVRLEVNGSLGDGASWVWYKSRDKKNGERTKYKAIGRGETMSVSSKKYRHYKVAAIGGVCDASHPITGFVDVGQKKQVLHKWTSRYYKRDQENYCNKIVHGGLALGPGGFYSQVPVFIQPSSGSGSTGSAYVSSYGLDWTIMMHPIIFERPRSLGLTPFSLSLGIYYSGTSGGHFTSMTDVKGDTLGVFGGFSATKYESYSFGTELAVGLRGFRIYFDVARTEPDYFISAKYVDPGALITNVSYSRKVQYQNSKLGLRFGRYASRNGNGKQRGVTYDVYVFGQQELSAYDAPFPKWTAETNDYNYYGFGFSLWIQSLLKFDVSQSFDSEGRFMLTGSLKYSLDFFY